MKKSGVEANQSERLDEWTLNAVVSLSASLVFGREKASEIAQPLLMSLFSSTSNDYKKALETVVQIDDFSVKRVFLEQFKYCYILNTGSHYLSALVSKVDFTDQQMSNNYDTALLKLFNDNNKDVALLTERLRILPIKAKRLALKRLRSEEFENFKKVKIRQTGVKLNVGRSIVKNWQWVLIFVGLTLIAVSRV